MKKIAQPSFRLFCLLYLLLICRSSTVQVYVDTTSTTSLGTQASPYSTLTQALSDASIRSQGGIINTAPSQTLSDLTTNITIPSSLTITITPTNSTHTKLILTSSASFSLQSSSCLNLTNIDLQIASSSVLSSLFSVDSSGQLIISNSIITITNEPTVLLTLISGESTSDVTLSGVSMQQAFISGSLTSVVSLKDNGFLNVSNSNFSNAQLTGATLFSVGQSASYICNCNFENFSTTADKSLISTETNLTLCNTSFKNITWTASAAGVPVIQMTDVKQNTSNFSVSGVTITNVATNNSSALLFQNAFFVSVNTLLCSRNTEGSCLWLEYIDQTSISNIQIYECSSKTSAAGIVALYPNDMKISQSSFISNIGSYNYTFYGSAYLAYSLAIQGGVATFIYGATGAIAIDSSVFNGNQMSSDPSNDLGGPSLVLLCSNSTISITNTAFALNNANAGSNNAAIMANVITIQNSSFIYNYPFASATLSATSNLGGALLFGSYVFLIKNCTFSYNSNYAGGALYFSSSKADMYVITQATIQNCTFVGNGAAIGGVMYYCDGCDSFPIAIDNVIFSNNTAYYGGVLSVDYEEDGCITVFSNSQFMFNMAEFDGGVLLAQNQGGEISFLSSSFFGNGAQGNGGVVRGYVSFSGSLEFANCNFQYNQATSAAILYIQQMTIELSSSTFQNDQGNNPGVFFFEQATVIMQSLYFYNEAAAQDSLLGIEGATRVQAIKTTFESCICANPTSCSIVSVSGYAAVSANTLNLTNNYIASGALLDFSKSAGSRADPTFNVLNSTYFNGNTGSGYLISLDITKIFLDSMTLKNNDLQIIWGSYSVLTLLQLDISNHLCPGYFTSCLMYGESNTYYTIQSVTIQNLTDTSTQGLAYIVNSELTIGSFSIANASGSSPVFTLSQGNLTVGQGVIRTLSTTLMSASAAPSITLSMLDFNNIRSSSTTTTYVAQSPLISCQDCVAFNLISSSFSNQQSSSQVNGGALSIINTVLPKTSFILKGVSVTQFSGANMGGAVYIQNSNVSVVSSNFTSNSAISGGAIYLDYDQSPSSTNPPVNNFKMTDSQFTLNTASSAGGALCTDVPLLTLLPNQLGSALNNVYSSNTAYYGNTFGLSPSILNVQLVNQSNGTVICDYDNTAGICYIPDAPSGQNTGYNIVLTLKDALGMPVLTNNGAQSSFSILTSSTNGSQEIFQLSGQKLTSSNQGVFNYSGLVIVGTPLTSITLVIETSAIVAFSGSTQVPFTNQIKAMMRQCIAGEIYNSLLNTCDPCAAGSYSLNTSDTECQPCMDNAVCLGGVKISVNPGYWRSSTTSTQIHSCGSSADSCLGGYYSNCSVGFVGPLCQSCDLTGPIKYNKSGTNCVECASAARNIATMFFLVLLQAIILIIGVKTSSLNLLESGRVEQVNMNSASFKIVMNYLQLVAILSKLDLNWPFYVGFTLQAQSTLGNIQNQVTSLDCFFSDFGLNQSTYFSSFWTKILVTNTLTYSVMLLVVLYWGVRRLFKKNLPWIECIVATWIVVGFSFQPSIVNADLSVLDCTEVDIGQKYISTDMVTQCYNSLYNFWTYLLVYPNLFVWIILLPGLVIWQIRKRRDELEGNIILNMKYGFLFNTYVHKYYYWEMIVFLRKVSILAVQALISSDVILQVIIIIIILFVCIVLQNTLKPFKTPELNSLELWGLRMSHTILLAGLLYYNAKNLGVEIFTFILTLIPISIIIVKFTRILYKENRDSLKKLIKNMKLLRKLGWKEYKKKRKEEKEASPESPIIRRHVETFSQTKSLNGSITLVNKTEKN